MKPIDLNQVHATCVIDCGKIYKKLSNGEKVKHPTWVDTHGYECLSINGVTHRVHRIVWALHTNQSVFGQIDHIDGNRANNNISNLRVVTNRQNAQNWQRHREGKKVGASKVSEDGSWQVSIMIKGRIYYIGRFDTEEQASEAYNTSLKVLDQFQDIISFRNLVRSSVSFTNGRKVGKRFYRSPPSNVGFDKSRNKWRVQLQLGGKNVMLGRFKTETEATEVAYAANRLRELYQNRQQFLDLIKEELTVEIV